MNHRMPPMRRRLALALMTALGVAGCTQFPELDATLTDAARAAPYPDLVPLDSLRARMDGTRIEPGASSDIDARIAALKARASRLGGSVIDDATRARMQGGVPR